MTWLLRVVLIVVSVLTTVVILKKVRQAKMRIEDSVFWIGFFFLLIVFSVFPQIVYAMSALAGTMTPANFIYPPLGFSFLSSQDLVKIKLSIAEYIFPFHFESRPVPDQSDNSCDRQYYKKGDPTQKSNSK